MIELARDEVDTSEGATVNDRRYAAKLIELAEPLLGRDHDRKVFLSDLMTAAKVPSPRVFLRNLVRLNRLGLIRLSRCDLPMAYNLEKVGRSEVAHHGASFHFLDLR